MHGGFPADAVLLHPGKRLRTMKRKHNSELFLLLYLGILSAFGPFVMDMYLPAFPVLTEFSRSLLVDGAVEPDREHDRSGRGTTVLRHGQRQIRPAAGAADGARAVHAGHGGLSAGRNHPRFHRLPVHSGGWPRPEASSSRGRSPPTATPSANSRGCWPS